jgi:hypothetical protein
MADGKLTTVSPDNTPCPTQSGHEAEHDEDIHVYGTFDYEGIDDEKEKYRNQ